MAARGTPCALHLVCSLEAMILGIRVLFLLVRAASDGNLHVASGRGAASEGSIHAT
jgi:hypothetical protein